MKEEDVREINQETSDEGLSAYPRLSDLWLIFLLFVILSLGFGFVLAGLRFSVSPGWLNMLGYAGSMGLLTGALYYIKRRREPHFRFCFSKPTLRVGTLVTLMTLALVVWLDLISGWLPPVPDWFQEIFDAMLRPDLPSLITVTVLAAFLEEMLCRGIILDGLLKKQSAWKAIFWSAFYFALMHMNPWQAVPGMLAGFFMGWLYWKSGSLWLPVWVHFINNGTAFGMVYCTGDTEISLRKLLGTGPEYTLLCLGSLCLLVWGGYYLSVKKFARHASFIR